MTPIKDFRRAILAISPSHKGFGFPVLWSDDLCIAGGWRNCIGGGSGNCAHTKKKKEAEMRWIMYKRNKYLDAFTENSNKNELSVPSLYIGQVMAMKLSGMFSYGWNQIWTSKLSVVKRIAVWRVLESVDLWRWQRELGAHILEAITLNVLRYARHPEFLIATSLKWLL